jgi:hypothetical protein
MQAIKTIDKNEIFVTGVNGSEDFDLALWKLSRHHKHNAGGGTSALSAWYTCTFWQLPQ